MTLWTADDLGAATGGAMRTLFDATGVSIDTRTLQPGDLFVALRGEHGDGHAHVAEALAKGAAGAMVRPGPAGRHAAGARHAGRAVGAGRLRPRAVPRQDGGGHRQRRQDHDEGDAADDPGRGGPTHAAPASYNNQWGVPLTLARMPLDAAFCVAEIGTNHPGEIRPLSLLVRPDVAVVTAIEAAHIGHFGSLEAIADEKSAIGDGLQPGGVAVLPADSRMLGRLAPRAPASTRSASRR